MNKQSLTKLCAAAATGMLLFTACGVDKEGLAQANTEAAAAISAWQETEQRDKSMSELAAELGRIHHLADEAGGELDVCALVPELDPDTVPDLAAASCTEERNDDDKQLFSEFTMAIAIYSAGSPEQQAAIDQALPSPVSIDDVRDMIFAGGDLYNEISALSNRIQLPDG